MFHNFQFSYNERYRNFPLACFQLPSRPLYFWQTPKHRFIGYATDSLATRFHLMAGDNNMLVKKSI